MSYLNALQVQYAGSFKRNELFSVLLGTQHRGGSVPNSYGISLCLYATVFAPLQDYRNDDIA